MHLGTGMAANVFQWSSSSAVSVAGDGNTQHGLDIFVRVGTDGILWVGDWGHDSGGMFGCGNDNQLGIAPTNIKLATSPFGPLSASPSTLQDAYAFNQPLSLDTSSVTDMSYMFQVRSARAPPAPVSSLDLPLHAACAAAAPRPPPASRPPHVALFPRFPLDSAGC